MAQTMDKSVLYQSRANVKSTIWCTSESCIKFEHAISTCTIECLSNKTATVV